MNALPIIQLSGLNGTKQYINASMITSFGPVAPKGTSIGLCGQRFATTVLETPQQILNLLGQWEERNS
jgi:hypothetical protein